MAVTSKPTAKKTTINFGNFGGRGGSNASQPTNRFASIGQTASNNIKQIDDTVDLEGRVGELEDRVTNIAASVRVLGAQNRSFEGSIAGIQQTVGSLQSGQKAIIDNARNKEKILAKQRKLEEQRIKREGAEKSLEDGGDGKKDVDAKDAQSKDSAKKSMGILDRLKQFLTFVVAGWFTDKTFKLIEAFQSGNSKQIRKIGLKLLAGTAAVAGIFSMALFGIGPVLGAIGSLIATLAGLLFNPVTLTALLIAVGVGGAIMGIRALWKWGRKKALGGEGFRDKHNELDEKLRDAGMTSKGLIKDGLDKHSNRTEEQQKIFEEVEAERARLKGLHKNQKDEIAAARKEWKANALATKEKGKRVDWEPHNKKWKETEKNIRSKYTNKISAPDTVTSGDGSNVGAVTSATGDSSNLGPVESTEGNVSVIPNFTEKAETVQKGIQKGVEPLSSGNSDNRYLLDAQLQYNTFV